MHLKHVALGLAVASLIGGTPDMYDKFWANVRAGVINWNRPTNGAPSNAPFGGIARITTLVKRIRRDSNRSLWLDSGDAFQGAPVFNLFKGEAEMRALSLAGMDAEVLGNHEFDLGAKNLYEKIDEWSQFPHLAANYAWDDSATK